MNPPARTNLSKRPPSETFPARDRSPVKRESSLQKEDFPSGEEEDREGFEVPDKRGNAGGRTGGERQTS